jgi:hypothetical protein
MANKFRVSYIQNPVDAGALYTNPEAFSEPGYYNVVYKGPLAGKILDGPLIKTRPGGIIKVPNPSELERTKLETEALLGAGKEKEKLKKFLNESDPNNIDQHAPGAKLDAGKPDASLLPMFGRALLAVAKVGTFGAAKYTRGGWKKVPDGFNRYTAACLRHLLAEGYEHDDSDSGLSHAAHAAWNALARLEKLLEEEEKLTDDHNYRLQP